MSVALERMLFTVDRYHEMIEKGILTEDDRVELLEGEIIRISPAGPKHSHVVNLLALLMNEQMLGTKHLVWCQSPITVSGRTEPEPDLAVLRPREDMYRQKPRAEDVLLVIEVADSSYDRDRESKLPTYAASGIPEVWIVDLRNDRVEVFLEPDRDGRLYKSEKTFGRDARIAATACELTVSFVDLLT